MSLQQEIANKEEKSTYQQQLSPWCLVQQLPKMQNRVVARFRRRNDADAHRRVLQHLIPSAQYIVVFDSTSSTQESKRADSQNTAL